MTGDASESPARLGAARLLCVTARLRQIKEGDVMKLASEGLEISNEATTLQNAGERLS